jgi:peptide/nickel transport system substrate-binding protein
MIGRALVAALGLALASAAAFARDYVETPSLADDVKAGRLPAVGKRLPETPAVASLGDSLTLGRHGGDWNMLVTRAQDVRIMVVFGYARLVGYNTKFEFVPDILEKIEVEGERVFTMTLRRGHRWSDGHPFTTEDFRYFWEDVVGDPTLSPEGPPEALLVDGEAPKVEILDGRRIRYSWSKPNPFLLPALAGPAPLYLYRPAHYLKRFHQKYTDPAELQKLVRETRRRNWSALHTFRDNQYRFDNPDMPTLEPWVNTTRAPATRFVMTRNP